MIYLDNAASTALSPAVLEAMLPWMTEQYGNPSSLHRAGQRAAQAVSEARAQTAKILHARRGMVCFTSGGTEADALALSTAAAWGERHGKRHIVSAAFEHHAVLRGLEHLAEKGFSVTLLSPGPSGRIRAEQVADAIRDDTALVSLMAANNETGILQPAAEVGALCRERGILFHTDAVQAVGHIPVDAEALGADLLSLSAHKFHGPKGVGALLCREDLPVAPLLPGGGQERGRRSGTENVPGIVGLAAALVQADASMEADMVRTAALRDRLAEAVSRIPGVHLTGMDQPRLPGILHLCVEGVRRDTLLLLLDQAGICASAGSACSAGALEPSHVLRSMDIPASLSMGALRSSLSPANTEEEIDTTAEILSDLIHRLKN